MDIIILCLNQVHVYCPLLQGLGVVPKLAGFGCSLRPRLLLRPATSHPCLQVVLNKPGKILQPLLQMPLAALLPHD